MSWVFVGEGSGQTRKLVENIKTLILVTLARNSWLAKDSLAKLGCGHRWFWPKLVWPKLAIAWFGRYQLWPNRSLANTIFQFLRSGGGPVRVGAPKAKGFEGERGARREKPEPRNMGPHKAGPRRM